MDKAKRAYVRLWNRALSSSFRKVTSSIMSSSDHFLPAKFFTNGRTWQTSIAGKFAAGALLTKFCAQH